MPAARRDQALIPLGGDPPSPGQRATSGRRSKIGSWEI
jgi:hypothetical protein